MDRNKRIGTLLIILAITLACAPVLPSVAPLPTQAAGAVDTIVAGTYAAASTGTAVNVTPTLTPRETLTPSQTPTITTTPTATIIFKTPTMFFIGGGGGGGGGGITITGTPGGPQLTYACKIMKIAPAYGSRQKRGWGFTTIWTVVNRGNVVWSHTSVDYLYWAGDHLEKNKQHPLYDLPKDVAPKGSVSLAVPMIAPKTPGTYTTTWIMQIGKESFCDLNQQIVVK
jgi:hypothetical protein